VPALNFKSQFADKVESGEKRQSIRKGNRIKVGDPLYLYAGQRTKACRKLGEAVCKSADPIRIATGTFVQVAGRVLLESQLQELARDDGFPDAHQFLSFFFREHGFPFEGQVIKW
jgi:hypothetical protein